VLNGPTLPLPLSCFVCQINKARDCFCLLSSPLHPPISDSLAAPFFMCRNLCNKKRFLSLAWLGTLPRHCGGWLLLLWAGVLFKSFLWCKNQTFNVCVVFLQMGFPSLDIFSNKKLVFKKTKIGAKSLFITPPFSAKDMMCRHDAETYIIPILSNILRCTFL